MGKNNQAVFFSNWSKLFCCVSALLISFQGHPAPIPSEGYRPSLVSHYESPRWGDIQDCGENAPARQLAKMVLLDPAQRRHRLVCSPTLTQVAMDKAREMAQKEMVTHYGGFLGANQRLRDAGYELPSNYPSLHNNQVEAVAGGFSTAREVWREFKNSLDHRTHLLGEHPFYAEQDEIGVGFYYDWETPHVEYWAVYIARKETPRQP